MPRVNTCYRNNTNDRVRQPAIAAYSSTMGKYNDEIVGLRHTSPDSLNTRYRTHTKDCVRQLGIATYSQTGVKITMRLSIGTLQQI
jgi:hypothetical protein